MKVYVAGAWGHRNGLLQSQVRAACIMAGWDITYPWWSYDQNTAEKAIEDLRGVRDADVLVVVFEDPSYRYQGCWVEFGYALAKGIPVLVIGNAGDACLFMRHPGVRKVEMSDIAAGVYNG